MANNNEKIFKIVIDYQSGLENLKRVNGELKESLAFERNLTIEHKKLDEQLRKNKISQAEYTNMLTANNRAVEQNRKTVIALIEERRKAVLETRKLAVAENAHKGSITELQASLTAMRIRYRELSQEQRKNSAVGGKLLRQISKTATEYKKLELSIGNTGVNAGNYVSNIYNKYTAITAVLYGVQKVITTLFNPFKDFEYQMDKVGAVAGATANEMAELEANARGLGESTEYTATQVAELQLNYARLGFSPDEILDVTDATLNLATATGEDLARSADIAGATLRGFQLEAKEMPRVIDVMADSFNKSALDLNYFAESMKYVAPIAKTAGVSLEQTTAMLGILADRGIRGSQAGTALRRILTEISISGKTASEALADLNAKGLTVSDAMDEVGRYAMTALTVLSENAPQVEVLTHQLNNATGAAKQTAAIMRDNLKGDVDKATSAMLELAITIGEALAPTIRTVIQLFTVFVQNIEVAIFAVGGYIVGIKAAVVAKALLVSTTKSATIVTVAETVAIKTKVLALRSATTATKLFAAAKFLLTGNVKAATIAIKMLGAATKTMGIGLAVAALAGLVTWFIKYKDSATAAEIAQKRVNDAHDDFANKQKERKSRSEELLAIAKSEAESQSARVQAFRELQLLYPDVLQNYTLESFLLEDIAAIRKKIVDSEVGRKLAADNKNLEDSLATLLVAQQKLRTYDDSTTTDMYSNTYANSLKKDIVAAEKVYYSFYKIVQQNKRDLEATQPIEIRIVSLDKNIKELEDKIAQMKTLAAQGGFVPMSLLVATEKELKAQESQRQSLVATAAAVKNLRAELSKLSNEQLEEKKTSGTDDEKKIASEILKQRSLAAKSENERKKAQEAQEKIVEDSNAKILTQQNALRDAEIALMQDGVAKKLALSEQAALKQQQAQDKNFADQLDKITKQQAKLKEDIPVHTTLEGQKTDLTTNNEALKTANAEVETRKRIEILRTASVEELQIYDKTLSDHKQRVEVWGVIAEKQAKKDLETEIEKQQKIIDAENKTRKAITDADNQYTTQKRIIETTADKSTKEGRRLLKEDTLKNELEVRKAKVDTYIAELNSLQALGEVDTERYDEILKALKKIGQEAKNIGKGDNPDGSTSTSGTQGKGFLQKMFGIDDESAKMLTNAAFDLAGQINNAIADAQKQSVDRRLQIENKRIDDESKSEKKALDDRRKRGLISEKKYQSELEKIDAKAEKRRIEADKKAFEEKKRIDTKAAIINTALSIAQTLAHYGFTIQGAIMAGLAAAQGAVQIATIQSQKYALGGVIPVGDNQDGLSMTQVKGPSHAQGGLRIVIGGKPVGEMEGDEILAIINKNSAAKYMPQLSTINQAGGGAKFASGGTYSPVKFSVPRPTALPNFSTQYEQLTNEKWAYMRKESDERFETMFDRLNERIDTIRVVVAESDITDAQQSVKKIKVMSTY